MEFLFLLGGNKEDAANLLGDVWRHRDLFLFPATILFLSFFLAKIIEKTRVLFRNE